MKALASDQKLRGGYYTPPEVALFLAKWGMSSPINSVLEPSCGDGNILEAVVSLLLSRSVQPSAIARMISAIELDEEELEKAGERLFKLGIELDDWRNGDFFSECETLLSEEKCFDLIVGNPPFIRFQNFQENHRDAAFRLMTQAGLSPTKLTNAWVPFVVASTLLLSKTNGRLAMVIPAELLQVSYAAELRKFLTDWYKEITIITFKKLLFKGVLQEVVLLLGVRGSSSNSTIKIVEANDAFSLDEDAIRFNDEKILDHTKDKWTQYFLSQQEIDLIKKIRQDKSFPSLGKSMDIDVGIVTGRNDYFVLTASKALALGIEENTIPIATRSAHIPGMIFSKEKFDSNKAIDLPTLLFLPPNADLDLLTPAVQGYIASGKADEVHTGYKCRIRNRWYIVPSIWIPDAFMLRQVHMFPRVVLNETQATCTDTIHRVRFQPGADREQTTQSFYNSLTFAFTEVYGRSYGGGILELEPNEAEKLPLPVLAKPVMIIEELDDLLAKQGIEAVLDVIDEALLIEQMGMTQAEVVTLRNVWRKLRDRRVNRKH